MWPPGVGLGASLEGPSSSNGTISYCQKYRNTEKQGSSNNLAAGQLRCLLQPHGVLGGRHEPSSSAALLSGAVGAGVGSLPGGAGH